MGSIFLGDLFFFRLTKSPLYPLECLSVISSIQQTVSSQKFPTVTTWSRGPFDDEEGCTCRMAHSHTDMPVRQCNVILWSHGRLPEHTKDRQESRSFGRMHFGSIEYRGGNQHKRTGLGGSHNTRRSPTTRGHRPRSIQ